MHSISGTKELAGGTVSELPRRRVDDARFEQMLDELAAMVAREHSTVVEEEASRRRAELAAEGRVVEVARLQAQLEEARAEVQRAQEISAEMAKLVAHEKVARERAEQKARELLHAHA